MKSIETFVENLLWSSRFTILVPVISSLIVALGVLVVTTVDGIALMGKVLSYVNPVLAEVDRAKLRLETISEVVSLVDGYLLAAILLIFALGLYELFIGKIDAAEGSEFAQRLLLIRSLDDLKDRLVNVILVILIVKFFQQALGLKYQSTTDVLNLAIGIALIGVGLYLSKRAKPAEKKDANSML